MNPWTMPRCATSRYRSPTRSTAGGGSRRPCGADRSAPGGRRPARSSAIRRSWEALLLQTPYLRLANPSDRKSPSEQNLQRILEMLHALLAIPPEEDLGERVHRSAAPPPSRPPPVYGSATSFLSVPSRLRKYADLTIRRRLWQRPRQMLRDLSASARPPEKRWFSRVSALPRSSYLLERTFQEARMEVSRRALGVVRSQVISGNLRSILSDFQGLGLTAPRSPGDRSLAEFSRRYSAWRAHD